MITLTKRANPPSENDKRIASQSSKMLDSFVCPPHDMRVQFVDEAAPGNILAIPASAIRLLNEILKEMAKGNAVTLIPIHSMLTTQDAADILNVSRPFLIDLLNAGKIPFQRLGSHRRIVLSDLMAFKEMTDFSRAEALRSLTEEAQELNMGY